MRPQDGSKMAQETPREAQELPKTIPRTPKSAPRWPQERTDKKNLHSMIGGLQDGPRIASEATKRAPKESPKSAPKELLESPKSSEEASMMSPREPCDGPKKLVRCSKSNDRKDLDIAVPRKTPGAADLVVVPASISGSGALSLTGSPYPGSWLYPIQAPSTLAPPPTPDRALVALTPRLPHSTLPVFN